MNKILAILLTAMLAVTCSAQAPATQPAVKLPTLASSKPLFFKMVFGPKATYGTLVVIDESKGPGKGYDIAYVDQNRDGDLTNDNR